MKSILFYIARYPGYGGIENITTLLANHFSSSNKVSILSCTQQDKDTLLQKLNSKISYYTLPNNTNIRAEENQKLFDQIIKVNEIDTIIYQDSYYPNEKLLLNVKDREKINVICVEHSAPDCSIKSMKYALTKNPWYNFYNLAKILYFHNLGIIKIKKRKQELYNFCNKYVLLSKGYIPIFIKLNKITNISKIKAIENPISIPILEVLPQKDKICLFVGRFSGEKGLMTLLKIWNNIEKDIRYTDWKFIMVGDGEKRLEVEYQIKKYGLQRIQLEGFKTDLTPYYKKASILCMTSIFEGFPLTLPEAMGNGVVPIVFNTFAAVSDIIDNEKNGIIIHEYNDIKYANQLKELMSNSFKREKLAQSAICKAHKFSQNEIFKKWEELIND